MNRFFHLLVPLLILAGSLDCAEEKVKLFSNFPVDPTYLNTALSERNIPKEVVITDLSEYETELKIDRSRWKSFLRMLSLDFSQPIQLSEQIVFWNVTRSYSKKHDLGKLPKEKLVLFIWEPPTVLGDMHSKETLSHFSKIYTWQDDLVDNQRFFKFYYPVLRPMIAEVPAFEEKKLCTLVSSNLTSTHPNELYSEREKAISYFEDVGETGFEFYGKKWENTNHPSYQGSVADKIDTIKNYRFSICFENICEIQGYVTEKIFDCFAAGNVPIYWGASNVAKYIPKDCFIDWRDFTDIAELHAFLKNMEKEEYEGYVTRIKTFLASEKAALFSLSHFQKTFCDLLVSK